MQVVEGDILSNGSSLGSTVMVKKDTDGDSNEGIITDTISKRRMTEENRSRSCSESISE